MQTSKAAESTGQEEEGEVIRLQKEVEKIGATLEERSKSLVALETTLKETRRIAAEEASASDTKFTKEKTKATAKIKKLEKQLEELKQVRSGKVHCARTLVCV